MSPARYTILVVIPDSALRELIGEVIEYYDHNPVLCEDEESALKALTTPFVVGVFDWELSKKKLPDIFFKVKNIQPKMGVLMLIDDMGREIRDHLERGIICSYVKKPFELKTFENALLEGIKKYNVATH